MSAPPAGRRRGSWARAFERFQRTVLRRKDNDKKEDAPAAFATTSITNRASLSAIFDPPVLTWTEAPSEDLPSAGVNAQPPSALQETDIVGADDHNDDDDGCEQPLLASGLGARTGLSDEKAKILFEKYGLKYQAGKPAAESSSGVQRVEKPIRIRVHWRCHECRVAFGQDRTCAACGHRKCRECPREPPKKIVQLLENPRQSSEALPTRQSVPRLPVIPSAQGGEAQVSARSTEATPRALPVETFATPLERDEGPGEDPADPATFVYTIEARTGPMHGTRLVHRPKAQIRRRVCHECNTQIIPPNREDCQKCGHVRCTSCPKGYPLKTGKQAQSLAKENALAKPAAVERVYKKPRQRVRWTCDRCQSPFSERDRCGECNHEKCHDCIRFPPKKEPPAPDPAVYRSVQGKLAAFSARMEQSQASSVPT